MPKNDSIRKVLIIGSGPIIIGQAAEFDYSGAQACLSLREEGIQTVLLNSNPATIMTDADVADQIYIEPMTLEVIELILEREQVDGIIPTLGGQTGLNLGMQIARAGLLEKYHTCLLGTSLETIYKAEDREAFRNLMLEISEPIAASQIVENFEQAQKAKLAIGLPLIIRPAYTMGGSGGGIVTTDQEFEETVKRGLDTSPIHQVLVEQSIAGLKEIEYEVMRDSADNCITICNMENMDPVGIHTGDSIVVAPSQTLSDKEYQMLRTASLKIIRALGVEGGCNIQFALDPESFQYYVIEVNPRVSRSSALASKATGYPIARIAAKIAIGLRLDEIPNAITQKTVAASEPALDYCVLKIPRFPFDKFPEGNRLLGSQMKATGEVMAIDRTFEGAMQKAIRSLDAIPEIDRFIEDEDYWAVPNDLRLFLILHALRAGVALEKIVEKTKIDKWFVGKLFNIVNIEKQLKAESEKLKELLVAAGASPAPAVIPAKAGIQSNVNESAEHSSKNGFPTGSPLVGGDDNGGELERHPEPASPAGRRSSSKGASSSSAVIPDLIGDPVNYASDQGVSSTTDFSTGSPLVGGDDILELLRRAKQFGFSDQQIAELTRSTPPEIKALREQLGILPTYKMVDTCAGEFVAVTPYFYSTWEEENEAIPSSMKQKAIVIGSGPIRIGQGIEFDYCSVHAARTLRKMGIEAIMVNNNPETVSTDFDISDRLYFEPLTAEDLGNIYENESRKLKTESLKIEENPVAAGASPAPDVIPAKAGIQSINDSTGSPLVGGDDNWGELARHPEPASPAGRLSSSKGSPPVRFIVQFGGQTSLSMASRLAERGIIPHAGFVESIELASNRDRFEKLLKSLDIPYPKGEAVRTREEAMRVADEIGYPVLVRPSFVLGGRAMQIVYSWEQLDSYIDYVFKVSPDAPVLVDRYITGKEAEVDLIFDGQDVLIPGIMEHIERAGIHSGDSMAVYPTQGLTLAQIDTIVDYSTRLAKAIGNLGLNNIQYVVDNENVYVIEANPRGSRTVPFLSKVTGIPMVELATRILYGATLAEMGYLPGLNPDPGIVAVKAPVFSFAKLSQVNTKLGPEMKSTGEVMGIDTNFARALYKAFVAAGQNVPEGGRLFATVADSDKVEALPIIRGFADLGFEIVATRGTSAFLDQHGIRNTRIQKIHDEGSKEILNALKAKGLQLVINTPTDEQAAGEDGPIIRQTAMEYGVPCVTSLDTARALLYALRARHHHKALRVRTMGEWVGL